MVEAAIVTPLFFLIILGILDFGGNFQRKILLSSATREVARAAVTAHMGEDSGCTNTSPTGDTLFLEATCLTQKLTRLGSTDVRVKVMYQGANGKQTASINSPTAQVIVCVMSTPFQGSGLWGPLFASRIYTARAVAKTAKPRNGSFVAIAAETPLAGADWSFCTADDAVGSE